MKHAVLGAGEIGKAIAKYLPPGEYAMCEPGTWEDGQWRGTENLHICIPYKMLSFTDTVMRASIAFMADNVIIHSTIPPGTTAEISKLVSGATKVYYSPVVGRHVDGFGLQDFKKFHAGPTNTPPLGGFDRCDIYATRGNSWGENTDALEFAKIMSTTYMYWNLMFQKELYRVCQERGYDFDKVYTQWNNNYNHGYQRQDHGGGEQFVRPVFKEVDLKPAGGHCLGANLLLDDNPITRILLEWEEKVQHEQRLSR